MAMVNLFRKLFLRPALVENQVIASDIAENMELVADHGIPFPRRDVIALTEKLRWTLSHPNEALAIGEKAKGDEA